MKRHFNWSIACVVLLIFTLAGCAVSTKDTVLISNPLSRATGEVDDGTAEGRLNQYDIPESIAILPFTNDTEEEVAGQLLRQVINSQLSGMNFRSMHPAEVDRKLPEGGPIDYTQMASYLGVDAVLVGEVVTFERFFAGIYAQIRLGVELKLYNTQGEVIWTGEHDVFQSAGGISTSAWGLLLNAAVAAMHLDDDNLLAAADELGRKIARDFPQPESYATKQGPEIESVLHDQGNQWLHYGDVIKVGVKGEPDLIASIQLGQLVKQDLKEVEPGVYMGEIVVDPSWNETRVPVSGILQDDSGNTTRLLSIAGLINFDNVVPSSVEALTGSLTKDTLKLSWQSDDLSSHYRVYGMIDGAKTLVKETSETFINVVTEAVLFDVYYFEVVAVDRASNESEPRTVSLTAYPREVGKQHYLSGPIQGQYDGIYTLIKQFSPYQINGPVTFSQSSEVYIEPGVELQFGPDATITLQGATYLWGDNQKISLVPLEGVERKLPYLIIDSQKAVHLNGVRMVEAGVGVEVKQGAPLLDLVEFVSTRFTALNVKGEANVTVRHCLIDGSNTSAVVVSDYAKLKMNSCTIRNNFPFHIQNASSYEVDATDNEWAPAPSARTILGKVKVK